MITDLFLQGRARAALTGHEKAVLENAISEVREVEGRTALVRAGQVLNASTYLIDGFVSRHMDDSDGYRQLVAIHVPGDFLDLHGFALKRLNHDVATLGRVRLAIVPHVAITQIMANEPHLARLLWFSTLLDAAMHREWIFRLGRLDATERVAHFFCELAVRLDMVGLYHGGRFALPITQAELAEACGVTGVHANRTLRVLREQGLMTFRDGLAEIHDLPALRRLAEFDEAYLYPNSAELLARE
jgi:CRP-like cAMP-binding protein